MFYLFLALQQRQWNEHPDDDIAGVTPICLPFFESRIPENGTASTRRPRAPPVARCDGSVTANVAARPSADLCPSNMMP
jgi:hypothetical protein